MARQPRFNLVGIPQHVIQRGNNREPCFYAVEDYQHYLQYLADAATHNACAIHAYVLMTNHVHLLATPFEPHGISHMMQDLGRKYVRYINHTYKRTGTLWEGRYKSSLVDSEMYLLTCMRYIEMNPVRAQMVQQPVDYRWSSYGHNAAGNDDKVIHHHPLYDALGKDAEKRQVVYRELCGQQLEKDATHRIRETLNQELVLGRDDFKEKIAEMINRRVLPGKPGRPRVEDEQGVYLIW